ncbi:rRNA methyltransferase 2, mitochondrial isoform X1 [Homalodisca vitripennis]|uniref:rRNA methyltransferase 2, mitochondrial isoform X1 n=1 Tax=Homalodisca vitripennis TaxID=197043 RepID=UPI001EECCE49|nr:rRNA methyltransferase 2, mitochondrial isoform X1 [Homalodisca vitripennis]
MIWCRSKINRLNNNGIKVIFCVYNISTSSQFLKESLKNASNFKSSSQKWLLRQINDSYVKKAKAEHYRCRSAFKLLEINEKYKILRSGQTVVDLGCAPGSWTQVAVKATRANVPGSKSLVVGIDLSPIHPIEGATLLNALDFTTDGARARMIAALNGRPVNVVLSDMAPSASGIKSMDHSNIIKLCYSALTFAKETSAQGGSLVMKAFDGSESKQLVTDAKTVYEAVHIMRPQASRKESSEIFFVCLRYKGITPPQQGTDEHNSDIQNVMTHGNDSGSDRGL